MRSTRWIRRSCGWLGPRCRRRRRRSSTSRRFGRSWPPATGHLLRRTWWCDSWLARGLRASELCGLAVVGPDGLPDVMSDSLSRGRVELRVRWDAGAKGQKARRVPIAPKLAAIVKRYEARHRLEVAHSNLLINRYGRPYQRFGIDKMMDRLQESVGFRV